MPIVKYVVPIKGQAPANEETKLLVIGGKTILVWSSRTWTESYQSEKFNWAYIISVISQPLPVGYSLYTAHTPQFKIQRE